MREKSMFIALMFLVWCLTTEAQSLTGTVIYNTVVIADTILNNASTAEGTLFFDINEKKSIYVTDRVAKPEPESHVYEKKDDGSTVVKKTSKSGDKVGRIIFKDFKEKKLIFRDGFNGKPFIVNDNYPEINWQILDSTKRIKDILCQKAEGDFRGRHYTAWFTNKILISDGPWKLCGLPGLILEAYDEKRQFIFEVKAIDFPSLNNEKLVAPTDGEETSFILFYKARKKVYDDLPKKIMAMLSEGGGTVSNQRFSYNLIERNIEE